jgi:hypothetical protein
MSQKSGARFTEKQGHYLAFIYTYSHMFGRPPAETDLQRHFRVSPPSVHQMIVTLERNGLIRRQPGIPRSIELIVPPENLPILNWLGIKPSKSLRQELVVGDAGRGVEAGYLLDLGADRQSDVARERNAGLARSGHGGL